MHLLILLFLLQLGKCLYLQIRDVLLEMLISSLFSICERTLLSIIRVNLRVFNLGFEIHSLEITFISCSVRTLFLESGYLRRVCFSNLLLLNLLFQLFGLFHLHNPSWFFIQLGLEQLFVFDFFFPKLRVSLIIFVLPIQLTLKLKLSGIWLVAWVNILVYNILVNIIESYFQVFLLLFEFFLFVPKLLPLLHFLMVLKLFQVASLVERLV